MPRTNREYWVAKIERNVQRDAQRKAALEASGWQHRVVWECTLERDARELIDDLRRMAPR
jgi:DNA mismatch endonuclease (patch repair protein)